MTIPACHRTDTLKACNIWEGQRCWLWQCRLGRPWETEGFHPAQTGKLSCLSRSRSAELRCAEAPTRRRSRRCWWITIGDTRAAVNEGRPVFFFLLLLAHHELEHVELTEAFLQGEDFTPWPPANTHHHLHQPSEQEWLSSARFRYRGPRRPPKASVMLSGKRGGIQLQDVLLHPDWAFLMSSRQHNLCSLSWMLGLYVGDCETWSAVLSLVRTCVYLHAQKKKKKKKKKKQPPGVSPCQREGHTCDMSPWISPVCFVTRRPAPIMQMRDGCCCSLRSRGSMREHIMLLHAGLSNTPVHETQSAGGPESSRLVRVLRGSLSLSLQPVNRAALMEAPPVFPAATDAVDANRQI